MCIWSGPKWPPKLHKVANWTKYQVWGSLASAATFSIPGGAWLEASDSNHCEKIVVTSGFKQLILVLGKHQFSNFHNVCRNRAYKGKGFENVSRRPSADLSAKLKMLWLDRERDSFHFILSSSAAHPGIKAAALDPTTSFWCPFFLSNFGSVWWGRKERFVPNLSSSFPTGSEITCDVMY